MKRELISGIKDALPVVLGYLPLGLAFGVLANNYGLSLLQVSAMSVFMYSGSGQFVAVSMLKSGLAPLEIVTAVFLVNVRYLLLSASIAPFFKKIPTWFLALSAHGITDETYAVALGRFRSKKASSAYVAGLFLTSYLAWIAGSVTGAAAGNLVGDTTRFGLDFALSAMFICLLVMQIKDRPTLMAAVAAGLLSVIMRQSFESGWNVVIATVLAASLGVILSRWKTQS